MNLFEMLRKYAHVSDAPEADNRDNLPAHLQEAFDERAAIMEFDGGLTREQAEIEARRVVLNESLNDEASDGEVVSQRIESGETRTEDEDRVMISTDQRARS